MKKLVILSTIMLGAISVSAKDIKTILFTTTPQMHCANCETKIKNALRFDKGVKQIKTNVEEQTVTVKFDADKVSQEKLFEDLKKIGYDSRLLKPGEKVKRNEGEACKNM